MTQIITINSLKGGVSKSTLAINLYYYYNEAGMTCGIIDADPQGSLTEELESRKDVPLLSRSQVRNWQDLRGNLEGDFIIIDTAPTRDAKEAMAIFAISDFVLIPCKASVFDVRALLKTIENFETAQSNHPGLKGGIVLTQGKPGTNIKDQLRSHVEDYGLPVLATEMLNRVDYQSSLSDEKGIFSTRNAKAKAEVRNIGIEIKNLLNHGK